MSLFELKSEFNLLLSFKLQIPDIMKFLWAENLVLILSISSTNRDMVLELILPLFTSPLLLFLGVAECLEGCGVVLMASLSSLFCETLSSSVKDVDNGL